MKRLTFQALGPRAGCRTQRWDVRSPNGTTWHWLGVIEFKATWRRYVFAPSPGTLFDASCLREVVDFIDQQMAARRAVRG